MRLTRKFETKSIEIYEVADIGAQTGWQDEWRIES